MRIYTFNSDKFKPCLPDDCQVNPNVYGFEFATWLAFELFKVDCETSYPCGEDWGWIIEMSDGNRELSICCTGSLEDGQYNWKYFVKPVNGFFWKMKWLDEEIIKIEQKIKQTLGSIGIVSVEENLYCIDCCTYTSKIQSF